MRTRCRRRSKRWCARRAVSAPRRHVIARVEVRGLVQGVGFRWFARNEARRLGIAGWVRNREDGSVEVAASGGDEAVRALIARLQRGPSGSRVDEVRELPSAGLDELPEPFDVR